MVIFKSNITLYRDISLPHRISDILIYNSANSVFLTKLINKNDKSNNSW